MRIGPAQTAKSEQGFVLIEILVSAVVLVIASAGVVTLLQTTVRSQGEERNGSQAYAIAQEDQARMGSMQLAALNHLDQTRTVTLNKAVFNVHSIGVFVNDETSTPSCGVGNSSADYVQITSTVTWPGMAASERAKIESILSPSNGSLDPSHGTLAVSVTNEQMLPMANVSLAGGSGVFAGLTDATGCAVFPDLPAGNYTMAVSAASAGLVNKDGQSSEQKIVPVVAGDAKNVQLQFDHPGTIPVNFKYRVGSSGSYLPATADSVVAYNTSMTAAKAIWTATTNREATVNAAPLYPFTSSYSLYAGSCASNNPNPEGKNPSGAPATAIAISPPGGTASPVTIQLPALELIVKKTGVALAGARVTITDKNCKDSGGTAIKRVYTSNATGMPSNSASGVSELGLPWGEYELCASANIAGSNKRKKVSSITVQNLVAATTSTIDLGSGTENAVCP